jgi:hypothetical protein
MACSGGREPVGARKQRRCRICKKRPPWRYKNCPANVCKQCYHRHVWPERPRARPRAQPIVDPLIDEQLGGTTVQDSLFEDEELPVDLFFEDPPIDEPPLEAPPPGELLLPSRDVEDDHRFDQFAPLTTEYRWSRPVPDRRSSRCLSTSVATSSNTAGPSSWSAGRGCCAPSPSCAGATGGARPGGRTPSHSG